MCMSRKACETGSAGMQAMCVGGRLFNGVHVVDASTTKEHNAAVFACFRKPNERHVVFCTSLAGEGVDWPNVGIAVVQMAGGNYGGLLGLLQAFSRGGRSTQSRRTDLLSAVHSQHAGRRHWTAKRGRAR